MQCSASRVTACPGAHTRTCRTGDGVSDVGGLDGSSKVVINKWSAGRGRVSQTLLHTSNGLDHGSHGCWVRTYIPAHSSYLQVLDVLFCAVPYHHDNTLSRPRKHPASRSVASGASDAFPEWTNPTDGVQGCCVDLGDVRGVPLAQTPCLCTRIGLEVARFWTGPAALSWLHLVQGPWEVRRRQ